MQRNSFVMRDYFESHLIPRDVLNVANFSDLLAGPEGSYCTATGSGRDLGMITLLDNLVLRHFVFLALALIIDYYEDTKL